MLAGTRARTSTATGRCRLRGFRHACRNPGGHDTTAYLFLPFPTFGCTSSTADANSSTSPNSRYTDAKRT